MKKQSFVELLFAVLFFAFCCVLTLLGFSDAMPLAMCFIFFTGITLILFVISSKYIREKNDATVFYVSYAVKLGYLLYRLFAKYGKNIVDPKLSTDAKRFWRMAITLYEGGTVESDTKFPFVLSLEFRIFGQNLFCFLLLNVFLTMLMMILVIKMLNEFDVKGNKRFVALLTVGFLPYEIIVSCSVLRESIYFIFVTLSFWIYYKYISTNKYKYLLASIIFMLPVVALHAGYFPIMAVYFIDSFINDKPKSAKDLLLRLLVIAAITGVVIISIQADEDGAGYVTRGITGLINKLTGEGGTEYADEAGSRYLAGLTINSVPTLILYTPVRWFYFLFSPLPTNWRGVSDIFAFLLDGCVHFYAIYSVLRAKKTLKKHFSKTKDIIVKKRILNVGVSVVILIALVFCLNTNTAGTAIRHRDVLIGIEAVLIGLSLMIRKKEKKEKKGSMYEAFQ